MTAPTEAPIGLSFQGVEIDQLLEKFNNAIDSGRGVNLSKKETLGIASMIICALEAQR